MDLQSRIERIAFECSNKSDYAELLLVDELTSLVNDVIEECRACVRFSSTENEQFILNPLQKSAREKAVMDLENLKIK